MKFKIEIWEDNEILRKKCENINKNEYSKYVKIWKEMVKYIKNPDNGWVWLAAPQIWINKRLIAVSLLKDYEDESFKTLIMINPEILEFSEECEVDWEWCLSLPWESWDVSRPVKIKLKYYDEKQSEKVIFLEWLPARIVQHEIDHIDWILFTDKVIKK